MTHASPARRRTSSQTVDTKAAVRAPGHGAQAASTRAYAEGAVAHAEQQTHRADFYRLVWVLPCPLKLEGELLGGEPVHDDNHLPAARVPHVHVGSGGEDGANHGRELLGHTGTTADGRTQKPLPLLSTASPVECPGLAAVIPREGTACGDTHHGRLCRVFNAPLRMAPLCCRSRRSGLTVNPMYTCPACLAESERRR